jgi:hypothetical protein
VRDAAVESCSVLLGSLGLEWDQLWDSTGVGNNQL